MNISTEDLIAEIRSLRQKTGFPRRTDGSWVLLDRLTRAERALRMRGIDPDTIPLDEPEGRD